MAIRTLDARDAEDFVDLMEVLDRETEFLMFEPGERPIDLAALRERLGRHDPAAGVLYGLVDGEPDGEPDGVDAPPPRRLDEPLAGFIGASRRPGRRNRHALHIVLAVRQSHVGRGHGRRLLNAVEAFARREAVTRLALTVMAHNARAIALYEAAGFELEGRLRGSVRLGDVLHDELAYAKPLGRPRSGGLVGACDGGPERT